MFGRKPDSFVEVPVALRDRSLVYFVSAVGSNAIKIGFTTDLESRLRELSTGNPFELLPVAAIFGPPTNEYTAHMTLIRHRLRGEWFDDCQEVWSYIEGRANYVLGREEPECCFVPLNKQHLELAVEDHTAHRGLVIANIREAFNASEITSRQRQILALRFGLDPDSQPMTLAQIGEILGVTTQCVQQLEAKSLTSLRRNRNLRELAGVA